MLNVLMTWLVLEVIAVCMVLYDYWRWYGGTETVPRNDRETERESTEIPAA